jgi:peptidoglycan-associated lipoprotein
MRRSPWTLILPIAVALLTLALASGCSSRKKVEGGAEPPPPPPTQTEAPPVEEPPPPPTTPPSTDEDAQANLQDAYFDYDDASLRDDAKSALEHNAKYMEGHTRVNIVIEGHCDERGSVEYNLALGEKRARAAKEYLTTYGINASRVTTISYGKERPFDPGHNEEAWARNRRAHFLAK